MTDFDSVVRSGRVVTPEGVGPASVGIRNGRIEALGPHGAQMPAQEITDLGDAALLPGCVDLGTGVQSPGQDLAGAYDLAAQAALSGGVTSVVAAPAPARPAITCAEALRVHRNAAAGVPVSVYFLGGVNQGTSPVDLADLLAEGAVAFLCSLSDGCAPDLAALDDAQLRKSMAELAALDSLLLVHSEDSRELGAPPVSADQRPPRAERRGLERVIAAARVVGARTHVFPFTAADSAALLAAAGSAGVALTAHTCAHYLCLPTEYLAPESPAHAFRPPLRSDANRTALWSAFLDGDDAAITTVGAGHLPASGLHTLEWNLSALWTALHRRSLGLGDLARWTASGPAELVGLPGKGRIAVGYDADLVAFDQHRRVRVPVSDPSPYAGSGLLGQVGRVWVAGLQVFSSEARS